VDCLRGTNTVDRVRMVHDGGRSLAEKVDMGQLEGGLVQGLGWMTMEELVFQEGRNVSDTLSTYKIPDLLCTPELEDYALYRDGNAITANFRRVMEERSGQKLDWFFERWLYQGGGCRAFKDRGATGTASCS